MDRPKPTKTEEKMNTNSLSTLIVSRKYMIKFLLIASLLPGLTLSCVPAVQASSSKSVNSNAITQPYETKLLTESYDVSIHHYGNDFEEQGFAFDPGAYVRAYPYLFRYMIAGHLLTRRSELGPLTGQADMLMVNTPPVITYNIAGQTLVRHSDMGPLTGDPDMTLPDIQPRITYNIDGQTLVRHSELGPLTGTTSNASQALTTRCVLQPPISYTIAGWILVRHSDLGILADTTCNSFLATRAPAGTSSIEPISNRIANNCVMQPPITYTIAGHTITRRSELGPLADSNCSSLLASAP
jgi:hypothetical protein